MTSGSAGESHTLVFDLDGTLCTNTFGEYEQAEPYRWAIERVNHLAATGHRIVIMTARGSATGIDWEQRTHAQLGGWGLAYDELRLGKPNAEVFVDDRAIHSETWRRGDAFLAPGFPLTAEGLPPLPAPALTAVAEIGRTFGGEPLELARHALRARELAHACGIVGPPAAQDLERAVRDALATAPVEASGDLVYTISIAGAGHAALIDGWRDGPAHSRTPTSVAVSRRPLAEAARGLRPPLVVIGEDGTPRATVATVAGGGTRTGAFEAASWPLMLTDDDLVRDALGGSLVVVRDGRLTMGCAQPGDVACAWLSSLADGAGLEVTAGPVTSAALAACDEAALVGMPFCLLPIETIDGRGLPAAPGEVSATLMAAWNEAAGLDLGAQLGALAR